MSYWSKLSMKDRADVMKLFLDKGISDLDTIRREYNTFAEGGSVVTSDLLDRVTQEEGFEPHPVDIGDGKMTLGSGLTSKEWRDLYEKRGRKWSQEDNRRAVQTELMRREQWAEKNVPNWNILPDSSKKALLSYKYNYDFTKTNSPKLFQALESGNFREAAKQIDATSKNPKFKKGLTDRRKREQEWFLADIVGNETPAATSTTPVQTPATIGISMPSITEPAVSTAVRNNYVPATTTSYNKGNNMRRAFESAVAFNRMMDATSIPNNPLPEYQFPIGYANGGKIHIDPSKKGTFTAAASRHGMGVQEFASRVLANKEDYSPAMVKKANFARNASKWHGLGGNLFEIGGDKNSYDAPQTFAGRVAHVAGASPRAVRGADVVSSVLQMTPYGYTAAALDLGRDMNRVYHGEEGAWKDAGLDILGMIPGVSKLGMKKIKPKTWIGKMKQGYDELLQPAREGVNSAINVLKALDFTDDTWGANKTSDVKQTRRKKY